MIGFFTWVAALMAMVQAVDLLKDAAYGQIAIAVVGVLIVRWIIARSIRKSILMRRYKDEAVVRKIMGKTIWIGATESMIKDSWGSPGDKKTSSNNVVWCYGRKGKDRWQHRITFRNGRVSSFSEK